MSDLLRRAVSSTLWTTLATTSSAILGFLASAITIRLLGVDGAGFATTVLAITALMGTIGGFGLTNALVLRFSQACAVRNFPRVQELYECGLWANAMAGAVGAVGLAAFAGRLVRWTGYVGDAREAWVFCLLAALAFAAVQVATVHQAVLDGMLRFDVRSRVTVAVLMLQTAATWGVLSWSHSLVALGAINAFAALGRVAILGILCRRIAGVRFRLRWSVTLLRNLWPLARWYYVNGLAAIGLSGMDRLLLVSQFGSGVLTYYTLPRRMYEAGHESLNGQMAYLVPLLGGQGADARKVTVALDDRLRWFSAAWAGWMYSAMLYMGPAVLTLVVSEAFAAAARWPLGVFAVVGFLHSLAVIPNYAAQAEGKPQWSFWLFAGCGLGVLPTMFLLGRWGGFDAAVLGQGMIGVVALLFAVAWTRQATLRRIGTTLAPVVRPAAIFGIAILSYALWFRGVVGWLFLAGTGVMVLALYGPILCRWEPGATGRVETLRRALDEASRRLGGSGSWARSISRWMTGCEPGREENA